MTHSAAPPFAIFSAPLSGAHLIDASAGTGKTYTISALFVRLLIEKNLTVDTILVVTYTKAATEDLRTRIREMILKVLSAFEKGRSSDGFISGLLEETGDFAPAKHRLQEALRNFDEASIFTIHGFCQRMLRENGLESSILFDTELVADVDDLLHQVGMDFWRLTINRCSPGFIKHAVRKMAPESLSSLMRHYRRDLVFLPFVEESWVEGFFESREGVRREEEYGRTFEQLRQSWQVCRQHIKDIFLNFDGFKQSSYKKEKIPEYLVDLERVLERRELLPGKLPASFSKFTTESIEKGTLQAADPPSHSFFDQCGEFLARDTELCRLYDDLVCALQQQWMRYCSAELRVRKNKQNILSFDDLLVLLDESLSGGNGQALAAAIRRQYPAALIDEFQDTDPVQYSIFSTIYEGDPGSLLYIIGDPKQAIYSFRGADIFTYKKAISDIGSGRSLEFNYRSAPGLIAAVNTFFAGRDNVFCDEDISFAPVHAPEITDREYLTIRGNQEPGLKLCILNRLESDKKRIKSPDAKRRIARDMAGEISRLLNLGRDEEAKIGQRPICPHDIAVLVRTNREAQLVKEALASCNVVSVHQGTGDLFLSREAWELERILEAAADPGSDRKIRSALATDMLGGTVGNMEGAETGQEWLGHVTAFHRYNELWLSKGFIRMLRTLLVAGKVHCQCLRFADGERRLTNILHLGEVLHQYAKGKRAGVGGLLQYFALKRQGASRTAEEHQLRLESDADRVQIVTIHRSKGLQYPIVFCPFAWGGSRLKSGSVFAFHMADNSMKPALDFGSEESGVHLDLARREELAENIRLLYVAMTRAKHRCYLYWGLFNTAESSALAWVLHGDAGRYKKLSDEEFVQDLQLLLEKGQPNIELRNVVEEGEDVCFDGRMGVESLSCRSFEVKITSSWRVTSFSGMTRHGGGAEMPDRDFVLEENKDQGGEEEYRSIFSFPRGAGAGTFMHDLLEHLDFGDIASGAEHVRDSIGRKLQQYGYAVEWSDAILGMLQNVVHTPLVSGEPGLLLGRVRAEQRLTELEFYFPLALSEKRSLQKIFAKHGIDERVGKCLDFHEVEGFLKGYIDLVFEYNGRYYIVDWKSNHLGQRLEYYRADTLREVMVREMYMLQYLLYTVALHQYLKTRIADYRYDTYFGGIVYLFLRGVRPESGQSCGIYYDLPDLELINDLSDMLVKK
ncbi:MAG: exodeoxyribonuclease V subunit beta [Desulfobulbaceae bacterium]|uniref:DNA 3'-5' helicase n=1 Tax=Candidatus Desulfobia pelagia TaxID=2841692 RepID=A0A8J6NAB9_9BACT|nr:exodeoxyribonuclease V subunit beta [Candidatus Desulfobia pelagia]